MKTKEIKTQLDKAYGLMNKVNQIRSRKVGLENDLKVEEGKPEIEKNQEPLATEDYYKTEIIKCGVRLFEIEKEYYEIIQKLA